MGLNGEFGVDAEGEVPERGGGGDDEPRAGKAPERESEVMWPVTRGKNGRRAGWYSWGRWWRARDEGKWCKTRGGRGRGGGGGALAKGEGLEPERGQEVFRDDI